MPAIPWTTEVATRAAARVWWARISQSPEVFRACREALSNDESDRLRHITDPKTAEALVIRRGTLRHLLAVVLGGEPRDLGIQPDEAGKPHLIGSSLEFSVSSSRDLALFAFSEGRPVGVNVQWIDPDFDYQPLLPYNFTEREKNALAGKPPDAFFAAWVKKEACAKALGKGLSQDLREFEVLRSGRVAGAGTAFELHPVAPDPAYRGALAVVD